MSGKTILMIPVLTLVAASALAGEGLLPPARVSIRSDYRDLPKAMRVHDYDASTPFREAQQHIRPWNFKRRGAILSA